MNDVKRRRGPLAFLYAHWELLLCMAVPALLVYLIYLARGIYPFGDGTVLVLDLNGQYVWFFDALRNAIRGDRSLLYTFERALGGEFMGIYAYYLASPFSWLVCLFPQSGTQTGLLVTFLLKTAICGGTFGYYVKRTAGARTPFAIILFSVCYAVSSYAVVQQHNTMWIDAMMWLPLITLGIEELVRRGKFRLYTFLLALTLASNFYIGYMVCFWCALYFVVFYLSHGGKNGDNNPLGERLHLLRSVLRMAFFSLLAIGMAAVVLLGAYYSLNFGKTTFSTTNWKFALNFDFADLLYKFLPGSYDTVRPEGMPFVYCGVLTLLLLPAYFLAKDVPMRRKIGSAVLVLAFVASFSISVVDLFWHGFQQPNWLNYRYSFMLCFYLCVLACRALEEWERISLKVTLGMAGLIALFAVLLQKITPANEYMTPNDLTCVWFTLACLLVHLSILGILRSPKVVRKRLACLALLIAVCAEIFVNGLFNMNALDDDVTYTKYSYHNNFLTRVHPLVDRVQASDPSFYRMEKTYFRKVNDNMGLKMRGLSGSTSTLNQETIVFLEKMGYSSRSHWSKYGGGTPLNDSLLGIKYILSANDIYEHYYETYMEDPAHGYTAYRNPYALPIAYGVDDALLDFPLGYVPADEAAEAETDKPTDEKKPSAVAKGIEKVKSLINRVLDIDETVRGGEYRDDYSSPFERLNAMVTAMLGEETTVRVFVPIPLSDRVSTTNLKYPWHAESHTCYDISDPSISASVTAKITMPVDGELYFYQPTRFPREIALHMVNATTGDKNDYGTFAGSETLRIVSLGYQTAGDDLSLTMQLNNSNLYYLSGQDWFYYIDWAVFEDAMERLAANGLQIEKFSEDAFSGYLNTAHADQVVLTTIAFDKGWKVTVDGKAVETVKALGSLVAFRVPGEAGTHTVKMVYRPYTLVVGVIVSLLSTLLFLLLIVFYPLLRRIPFLRAVVGVRERKRKPKPSAALPAPPAGDPPQTNLPASPSKAPSGSDKKPLIAGGIAALGATVAAVGIYIGLKKHKKE